MQEITASVPCTAPPAWAVLERTVFDAMAAAVEPFLAKYTATDGTLHWGGTAAQHGRDDVDDFYEASYNWPLLYLLGGDTRLLEFGMQQWEAVTRQLTTLGLLHREYERGADWFHQGESMLAFYYLCLADPQHPRLHDLARCFANFYIGTDPDAPNYDPAHNIIRAPHNGSAGPRWGYTDGDPTAIFAGWYEDMAQYGLPFDDVPEVRSFEDLRTPSGAAAMGAAMQLRFGRGDVAINLLAASLVTNAYLLTGEAHYRDWVSSYVAGWHTRAVANDGILPDNVGLDRVVGSDFGGRWHGGLYGWQWPHGFYTVGMAAVVASCNAYLLTRDAQTLDLARNLIDAMIARGRMDTEGRFVVPYRHDGSDWFDYQPMALM